MNTVILIAVILIGPDQSFWHEYKYNEPDYLNLQRCQEAKRKLILIWTAKNKPITAVCNILKQV